ncbi:helix-turn-helix domain-containing protein [Longimicrobium sp.]|uniref:helix-turn-helix domain-containing protein n=1 Tax=Longimicrobium sp. TaxID=2029185 RepID=UPI003B3BCC68
MEDSEFQALLGAVQDCYEHYMGLRHDLRTTILPAAPEPMDAVTIRTLRERIGASQAVFAMALNVSTKTVQAWESGARTPDGGNLKLLRVGEATPEAVFGELYQPPPVQSDAEVVEPLPKPRSTRKPRPKAQAA